MKTLLVRMAAMAVAPFVWFFMVHFPPPPHYFIWVEALGACACPYGGRWVHCSVATAEDHKRASGFMLGRL